MSILQVRRNHDSTAPFWQAPGVGWESVPVVPYESFAEFRSLLNDVVDSYAKMVREGLEVGVMQLWSVSRYGLSVGVKSHWLRYGVDIMQRLTKGVGREWCESVNFFLVNTLDTTARVFVFCRVPFPVTGFGDFRDSVQDIFDVLERELCLFMHNWNIHPMGTYSFYLANFRYYRSLSAGSSGFDDDCHYLPMGKFQDIMAAFAMGIHPRLGSNQDCVVSVLNDELLRCIFTHGVF